jgi:class 3 adenylate cyclase/Tfp pilus assembly protein PilF
MAGTRQLAAIMFTDIDGYDALMQHDESTALEIRERHMEVLHQVAEKFNGKILESTGYSSLSLYSSAVDAVRSAVEMQRSLQQEPVVPVKTGIHLGDIIYSDEGAFGEGIKVARKIENQALPGSVLISNKIYEEVKNQRGIETVYIKTCELEEQGQQVKLYALTNEGLVVPDHPRSTAYGRPGEWSELSGIRRFWEEAKRRNVIRVVAWYAGAAFVILDLFSNIADPLNLPRWLQTGIVLLVIIGFPVSAIFFWIFDITPEGLKKTKPAREFELVKKEVQPDPDANLFARKKIFRRYMVPLFVVIVLAGIYFFKDNLFQNWEHVNRKAREHTEIANLYLKNQADPALIKQELDLALEADPDYDSALYAYALIHTQEGDTLMAKQDLHKILESHPGYSKAWDLLAIFAFRQDSFEKAMSYSILAMEANPGNYFAAYNLAIQSEDRGLFDQAVAYFVKATQMDSTFTPAFSALGALYNRLNRPTDAVLALRKSLRISPASMYNFLVYKNLAEAYLILEEYNQVLDYLEQSKTLNPDYPGTEKCYARYYQATGDTESSILHWRRYLALETDTLELRHAQQQLDSLRNQVQE